MRALLLLAVLLALLGAAHATYGDNGLTTYTGRKREPNTLVFGNDMVSQQATQATLSMAKDLLKGNWRPVRNDPPTEKREVQLQCLNSVAPEPLNWKMWCPGTDARVVGWQDRSGAAHRQITLRPQKGMTSTMYQWFITTTVLGLMPPIVEYQGNHYHYYHLWHPLDHVESTWTMGAKVPFLQKGPPVYVLIHERYRNPANFTYDRHYETNGWFYVEDAATNLMKNRYVITMPYMGLPTWTMILEFNDTPNGLVVDVEVIAGVPHKGYDDRAPHDGYRWAAGLNELFTAPLLAKQKGSFDWDESINAISRHVIEEFSNLQHFVPYLYEKCNLLGQAGLNWVPTLGSWLQLNNKSVLDSNSVSFYNALEKMARLQVNVTGRAHTHVVDAGVDILNKTVLAGAKAMTVTNEQLSRKTFVPISNKLTRLSFMTNRRRGAHPKVDVTFASARRSFFDKALNRLLAISEVKTETVLVGGGRPHIVVGNVTSTQPAQPRVKLVVSPPAGTGNSTGTEAPSTGSKAGEVPQGAGGALDQDDDDSTDDKADAASQDSASKDTAPAAVLQNPALPSQPSSAWSRSEDGLQAAAETDSAAGQQGDDGDDDTDGKASMAKGAVEAAKEMREKMQGPVERKDFETTTTEEKQDLTSNVLKSDDDDDEDDFVVVDEADGADAAAAQLNAALLAAYMDTTPALHSPESTVASLKAAVKTAMGPSAAKIQSVSPAGADKVAIDVPGIKVGSSFDMMQGDAKAAAAASINNMMISLKKDILDGLENGTIKFYAATSTLHIPEAMLVALSAKHALHKGVLAALLTKTAFADMGLGVDVNFVTAMAQLKEGMRLADAAQNTTAAAAPQQPAAAPGKGPATMNDILNSTVLAQNGNITIRRVPHHVFASLADGSANITAVPLSALPGPQQQGVPAVNATRSTQGLTGTKRLKESLVQLGESLKRARAVAANLKPHAVTLGQALPQSLNFSGGNSTAAAPTERSKLLSVSINKLPHQG